MKFHEGREFIVLGNLFLNARKVPGSRYNVESAKRGEKGKTNTESFLNVMLPLLLFVYINKCHGNKILPSLSSNFINS